MRSSLRTKVAVGFAVPLLLMTAAAPVRYWATEQTSSTAGMVVHSDEAIAGATELATLFADMQRIERSFIVSRSQDDLGALEETAIAFAQAEARLELFVADNPAQVERLRRVSELFKGWRSLARADGAAGQSAGRAVDVRDQLRQFIETERELRQRRIAASASANEWLRTTTVAVPAVAMLIGLASAVILSGRIGRRLRELTSAAEALAAGNMGTRALVTGDDELTAVARAFNSMADRLAERSRQAALLTELADGMQASLDLQEAYALARRFMGKAAASTSGAVCMHNASRDVLTRVFAWGDEAAVEETWEGADCLGLRRGREQLVADVAHESGCTHLRVTSGAALCVPLVAHAETVGVLTVTGFEKDALYEDRLALFRSIGERLGLAFANLQLRERLRSQSIRDALTGLFNRRYLEETFTRELARAARAGRSTGVLLFDVDHFKRFNDTFGHDAGDAVLRELGLLVKSSVRGSDVPCRYGGEEFLVLFSDVSLDTLQRRAERLRAAMKNLTISHRGQVLGPVTISIGLAVAPQHGLTPEVLIEAADKALYAAKAVGRDRVVTAAERPAPVEASLPPAEA